MTHVRQMGKGMELATRKGNVPAVAGRILELALPDLEFVAHVK